MIEDPTFIVLAVIAFLMVGIGKAGFGGGLGALAIPMMAMAVPVAQAATIILPALMLIDIFALWLYRGKVDWRVLWTILPGGMLGLLTGYLSFFYLNDNAIRLTLGGIALSLVFHAWYRAWRLNGAAPVAASRSHVKGNFWSWAAGLTSFVANAGGPAMSAYLLPLRLDKSVFTGTNAVFFAVMNYSKIPPFLSLGQFTDENLITAAVLLPIAPIGVWLGFWMHKRLDDRNFYRWVYGLLLLTGIKLIWDGLSGLGVI